MISVENESLRIQHQAFLLLEEIVSEPLYYIGANMQEEERVRKLLMAANPIHGMIIQSVQVGNLKRAIRYLLVLRKIKVEIKVSGIHLEDAIDKKFRNFHALVHE